VSTLSNLLRLVEQKDAQLAADIANEVKALGERREFGLKFERHTPEDVELPGRLVRKGDKVRFLAARGSSATRVDQRLWRVTVVSRSAVGRVARLARQETPESDVEITTRAVEGLVVVAEFRNSIYPGLVSTGKVERGDNKPFHTVINSGNFHALQADVKRWILTHRHQDLQDEFRARVARHGSDPEPVRLLKARVQDLLQDNQRLRAELREAKATTSMLERLVAVEALEAHTTPRPGAPPGPPTLRPVT